MNSRIKSNAIRVGLALLAIMSMVTGMALPAVAAPAQAALHTVQGSVTSIAADGLSFVVQSGNQAPVVVKVTQSTWYLVVPLANSNNNGNGQKASTKNDDKNKQSRGKEMKDLRIPGNWKSDLGWLEVFRAAGTFSDIQVGDRITARVTADGTAQQVLIVKAPAMQQARGTIVAIAAGSITITTSTGTSLTLTSNANTKVSLKGYFVAQVGQNVVAVYNRNTMVAQTLTIQSNQAPVTPPANGTLTAIAVTPATPANLIVGLTQQFAATATYSNGAVVNVTSSATWVSTNTAVATVVAGVATGIAAGNTAVTASLSGVTSPAVTLNVVAAPVAILTSIAITPAAPANLTVGLTQQFAATATYSNGALVNVTSSATWASTNTTVATVSAGLATGITAGTTSISATFSGVTSPAVTLNVVAAPATVTSIAVTPATPADLQVGLTQQFTATATYSNATVADVSATATWASSNTTAATVSAAGLATGAAAGTTQITASLSGVTSPAIALTVVAPTLLTITVTPASPASLHVGATQQFAAMAAYSNGSNIAVTTSATWVSSNTTAAAVSNAGLAMGIAAGTTSITAAMSGITSAPVALTVIQ